MTGGKAAAACAGIAVLAAAAGVAGCIHVAQGRMEDAARQALMACAMPGMEAEAGKISASVLSRKVTVDGWRTWEKGHRKGPGIKAARVEAVLENEAAGIFLPFIGGVGSLAQQASVPVFKSVAFTGIETFGTGPGKATVKSVHAEGVRMKGALLRELYEGRRPAPADAVLGVSAHGTAVEDFRAEAEGGGFYFGCRRLAASGIRGASAESIALEGAYGGDGGRESFAMKSLNIDNFSIADGIVRRIGLMAEKKGPTLEDAFAVMGEARRAGPIFSAIGIGGVAVRPEESKNDAITLEMASMKWKSMEPFELASEVRGLKIPMSLVDGLRLRGLDVLEVEFASEDRGILGPEFPFAVNSWEEKGSIRAAGLFSAAGTSSIRGEEMTSFSLQIADEGGMARIADIFGQGGAAFLKQGAAGLCAADGPEGKSACEELVRFIEKPGKLNVSQAKEIVTQDDIGKALEGRLGTLLRIKAEPGDTAIEAQIAALPQ